MASNLYQTSEFQKLSFGDKGLRIIAASATSVAGEKFCAIQAIESGLLFTGISMMLPLQVGKLFVI